MRDTRAIGICIPCIFRACSLETDYTLICRVGRKLHNAKNEIQNVSGIIRQVPGDGGHATGRVMQDYERVLFVFAIVYATTKIVVVI